MSSSWGKAGEVGISVGKQQDGAQQGLTRCNVWISVCNDWKEGHASLGPVPPHCEYGVGTVGPDNIHSTVVARGGVSCVS